MHTPVCAREWLCSGPCHSSHKVNVGLQGTAAKLPEWFRRSAARERVVVQVQLLQRGKAGRKLWRQRGVEPVAAEHQRLQPVQAPQVAGQRARHAHRAQRAAQPPATAHTYWSKHDPEPVPRGPGVWGGWQAQHPQVNRLYEAHSGRPCPLGFPATCTGRQGPACVILLR